MALYKALLDAGVSEELAERAAESVAEDLVEKADLAALEIRLLDRITRTEWRIIGVLLAAGALFKYL